MTWAMNRANNAMYKGIVNELEIQDNLRILDAGFGVFYNAVITKESLDSIFYTKSGFKKFENEEYIKIGRDVGFVNVEIKPLGHQYGLLVIYRK